LEFWPEHSENPQLKRLRQRLWLEPRYLRVTDIL
jgi:hypothetical protein